LDGTSLAAECRDTEDRDAIVLGSLEQVFATSRVFFDVPKSAQPITFSVVTIALRTLVATKHVGL
jgi:hypothetical protein